MNIEQIIEKENRDREEWEARTVVTTQGETIATLRKISDRVFDSNNWKAEWAAFVPHEMVGAVSRAVEYFHADRPEIVGIQELTGKVLMRGHGYMAD